MPEEFADDMANPAVGYGPRIRVQMDARDGEVLGVGRLLAVLDELIPETMFVIKQGDKTFQVPETALSVRECPAGSVRFLDGSVQDWPVQKIVELRIPDPQESA